MSVVALNAEGSAGEFLCAEPEGEALDPTLQNIIDQSRSEAPRSRLPRADLVLARPGCSESQVDLCRWKGSVELS